MSIIILGRIPSKKNSKIMVCRGRTPMLLPSQKHQEWHKLASQQVDGFPAATQKDLTLSFWFPDNRGADLTNKAESVMDLLVDNNILEDDAWQVTGAVHLLPMGIDRENPRVEVEYA
jgi:hypothetical protein